MLVNGVPALLLALASAWEKPCWSRAAVARAHWTLDGDECCSPPRGAAGN